MKSMTEWSRFEGGAEMPARQDACGAGLGGLGSWQRLEAVGRLHRYEAEIDTCDRWVRVRAMSGAFVRCLALARVSNAAVSGVPGQWPWTMRTGSIFVTDRRYLSGLSVQRVGLST